MQNVNKETKEKIPFFKKVVMSVKNFEKYDVFARESIGQALIYLAEIMAIFVIIITAMSVYNFSKSLNNMVNWFETNISEILYEDGNLTVNNNEKVEINELESTFGKIIIDTSDLTDTQIEEFKSSMSNEESIMVFLKDKIIIKNSSLVTTSEINYKEFFETYKIDNISKEGILDYYNKNLVSIYANTTIQIFGLMFILYMTEICFYAFLLGVLANLIGRIIGMRLKFSATFNMSVHSFTLPIILNIIYVIINYFTGFTIKYFSVMYTAIAFIYVITAIFMIKSDYIKKHMEIQKIESEQDIIRRTLQEKEEKKKEEEEREKSKKEPEPKEDDSSKNDNQKEKSRPSIGDKPQGNNA